MFWSLPVWHKCARRICAAVRRAPGPVKILLKVRNDPIFLAAWHRHHAAIVGAQNLIIADNMSDDPQTKTLLRTLAKESTVFRFAGFHNRLSDRTVFADLWHALDESCKWHMALDADERLGWIEDDHCITDARLVDRLLATPPHTAAIPALLLDNIAGKADCFAIPQRNSPKLPVLPCALWGKPALAAGKVWPAGMALHNVQFHPDAFAAGHAPNLIQMHLCNLIPEQRLRANREKLVARKICTSQTPFEKIAAMDLKDENRSVVERCVQETRKLLAQLKRGSDQNSGPMPDHVQIGTDGCMVFSTSEVADRFNDMMAGAGQILAQRSAMPEGGAWWGKSNKPDS